MICDCHSVNIVMHNECSVYYLYTKPVLCIDNCGFTV